VIEEIKKLGSELYFCSLRKREVLGNIEVNVLNWRGDFCKLEGKATVNGQLAAEGTVMCKMIDRDPPGKTEEPAK